jgi:aspartate kinase
VLLNGQQPGIISTVKHGDAKIVQIKPENILGHVVEGEIVVVAGFQGATESGEITNLERGGSDTSATAFGAVIEVVAVEIYTDVNGIMTADPRIVPAAFTIASASHEEVYQLAVHGAKLIHPWAVEIALRHNIPLKIKCTFTDEAGTGISSRPNGTIEQLKSHSIVGIAHQSDYGTRRLLSKLVTAGVDVDYLNISKLDMELVASAGVIETAAALARETGTELAEKLGGCGKISLVGRSANNVSSLTDTFIEVLRRENIEVLQTYIGPYAISGIVDEKNMIPTIQALHGNLFETQRGPQAMSA